MRNRQKRKLLKLSLLFLVYLDVNKLHSLLLYRFLGKLFACSYSIAGCNVLSGNPTDHVSAHGMVIVLGS